MMREPQEEDQQSEIDPEEFLRALLRISPQDAEQARADSPEPDGQEGHEGPYHDCGDV